MLISEWSTVVCSSDLRAPQAYGPKDTLVSLSFGLGSSVAGVLFGGFALAIFIAAYEFRMFEIGWSWWAWALCFVLDDLAYYGVHRAGHRIRWFWAAHVNHHSSQHYNLSTALRQSWTGAFTLGLVRSEERRVGKRGSVRVDLGGRRNIKKKKKKN